ncbi:MAG TPA: NAD(P)-binding domain-containing protein, partial [Thermoanaerobaculia bacterium]|nr:NAD(P)-binding domain-containing protein [Thermoanaerobaculia bacterium]
MLAQKRIAVIGSGTMGRSIASGLLRSGKVRPRALRATARTRASAERVTKELGIPCATANAKAAAEADIVLLCVKPKDVAKAVESIRGARKPPLVVSIAAGISTGFIEGHFGDATPVLRA